MAMDHFDNRNGVIVPELGNLSGCSLRFANENPEDWMPLDSGFSKMVSLDLFMAAMQERNNTCAMNGPSSWKGFEILRDLARYYQVPQVGHYFQMDTLFGPSATFSVNMLPSFHVYGQVLLSYLTQYLSPRRNVIAILHDHFEDMQAMASVVVSAAPEYNVSFIINEDGRGMTLPPDLRSQRDRTMVERIRNSGIRTVLLFFHKAFFYNDTPTIWMSREC